MPFSDPFNNAPPASVTPSRGAPFDNTVPAQSYATAQAFESSANASWSPTNATPQTVNGIILPSPAQFDFLDELAPGMPFGSGTIYSVVINSGTVYPLLIATSGSYSIYATNAGVQYFYDPSTGNQRVEITGSVKITNPNGYEAIGAFRYVIPSQGSLSGALTAPWFMLNFEIYLSSSRLTTQPSNTAPARTFNIKTQLNNGNVFDNSLPATTFSSRLRVFFQSVPSYYPAGANYLTGTGFTLPGGSGTGLIQIRSGTFITAFSANQAATLYSVILDGQHKFPLLLCTSGGYSFYATNAGGFQGGWPPNGSCLVVGPNGYTAMGFFNYSMQGNADGTAFPGNCELYVYVNETNRFLAQPTNTAPEARP